MTSETDSSARLAGRDAERAGYAGNESQSRQRGNLETQSTSVVDYRDRRFGRDTRSGSGCQQIRSQNQHPFGQLNASRPNPQCDHPKDQRRHARFLLLLHPPLLVTPEQTDQPLGRTQSVLRPLLLPHRRRACQYVVRIDDHAGHTEKRRLRRKVPSGVGSQTQRAEEGKVEAQSRARSRCKHFRRLLASVIALVVVVVDVRGRREGQVPISLIAPSVLRAHRVGLDLHVPPQQEGCGGGQSESRCQ
mmetsp:Transcript_31617/g.60380  ORF Transcript_31617/g.60380 Transcript_31617/m.60380 type:complete len:247 (-) Transcript_31617:389-1129(-)